MEIWGDNNEELPRRWKLDGTVIDVEITVGNVWMTFSGTVQDYSRIELSLAQKDGEISISLFCCSYCIIEPQHDSKHEEFWHKYCRVVQITTDGGALCKLNERRK